MKKKYKGFDAVQNGVSWFVLLFFLSFFYSCKENVILPSDVIPQIDNINTFGSDTFTLHTHTIYQDSLQTGGLWKNNRVASSALFYHALGTIASDPVFGKTVAGIYLQVLPPTINFQFKTNASGTQRTIDSVILVLPYKAVYGDTIGSSMQTYNVYRSLKSFSRDSAQFELTKDSIDYNRLLSSLQVNLATLSSDSPTVNGVKLPPQLRFKLASWFADSLQTQVDLATNGAAANFSSFLEWWKGFSIVPDTNNGKALAYFDTYNTRMFIYYRYTNTNNIVDTTLDVFAFDPNNCNRFNSIRREYTSTPIAAYINTNSTGGDSLLAVQSEPGLTTFIHFPHLSKFENVIVNRAEMIFTASSPITNWSDTSFFPMHARMQLIGSDNNQNDKVLDDYTIFGSNFVDGRRQLTTINGNNYIQYKFKLTHSIQRMISLQDSTYRIKMMGVNDGFPAKGRTILIGSSSLQPLLKPKLSLIYTKINK